MQVFTLFETNQYKTKSTRVFLGVFKSHEDARQAYLHNDGDDENYMDIVEITLGKFEEA